MKTNAFAVAVVGMLLLAQPAWSAIEFDQSVTPDVIFGSGNANGSFTTDRRNDYQDDTGVELGLRAKLRHNASGLPENTFNSNGDGTYSFAAGSAPFQSASTAVWSFEWSINSDYDGTTAWNLSDLTYLLSIDTNPSAGTSFLSFDPINGLNLATGAVQWDHAIGDNSTGNGGGSKIPNSPSNTTTNAAYATAIGSNNVAQNSWKPHWFIGGFDPTVDGTYDFQLQAFGEGGEVASTSMQVIVGAGGAVPEPVSMIVWTLLGTVGLSVGRRRYRLTA